MRKTINSSVCWKTCRILQIVVKQQTNNYSAFDQILTANKTLTYDFTVVPVKLG